MRGMELTLTPTVILASVSALLTFFFGYMGARPLDIRKGPRMVPWRFLMILAFTVSLFMVVHLLNLLGIQTKPPERY